MKIRIKGNSIRLRLSKSEVAKLAETGKIEEQTNFPGSSFRYTLYSSEEYNSMQASFKDGMICISVPSSFAIEWPFNDVIGLEEKLVLTGTDSLHLLVEKDFVCNDATNEDQSDNYENPQKAC